MEESVIAVQVSIFSMNDAHDWVPLSTAEWTEMHLFRVPKGPFGKFRLVAWVPGETTVVLNQNLTADSEWVSGAPDFVEFQNPKSPRFGMYFPTVEDANATTQAVLDKIARLKSIKAGPPSPMKIPTIQIPPADSKHAINASQQHLPISPSAMEISAKQAQINAAKRMSLANFSEVESVAYNASSPINQSLAYESVINQTVQDMYDDKKRHGVVEPVPVVKPLNSSNTPPVLAKRKLDPPTGARQKSPIRTPVQPIMLIVPLSSPNDDNNNDTSTSTSVNASQVNGTAPPSFVPPPSRPSITGSMMTSMPVESSSSANYAPTTGVGPDMDGHSSITRPQHVNHALHVSFNERLARYEGLPADWISMNVMFGKPVNQIPRVTLEAYEGRIPAVLEMLKRRLIEQQGLESVGIFRLAPDKEGCSIAKKEINEGRFNGTEDVNIYANLIKIWFRDLPETLFDPISEQSIYRVAEAQGDDKIDIISTEIARVPEPNKSLLMWLLDVMSLVVIQSSVNKMGTKNLAIVISPNLFSITSDNPMYALTMSQKIADFTQKLLSWRLTTKYNFSG